MRVFVQDTLPRVSPWAVFSRSLVLATALIDLLLGWWELVVLFVSLLIRLKAGCPQWHSSLHISDQRLTGSVLL